MKLVFSAKPAAGALTIYPVFEKETVRDARLKKIIAELARAKEFEAKSGQTFFDFQKKTLLLGLGNAKKLNVSGVMAAFGSAAKTAAHHRAARVAVAWKNELEPFAEFALEALILANYHPSAPYKTGKSAKKIREQQISEIGISGAGITPALKKTFQKAAAVAAAVNDLRDWVNAPPNFSNAEFFDAKAAEIAKETGAKLTIMKKKELEKLGMGAILGVNRGSPDEARLIILDYNPKAADPKENPIVLVGKGILFDSGGYNLKPRGHIEDMQLDKAGAAAVLATIKLLPIFGISKRVIAVAPFTENLIGRDALKPSEILKTYSGKTIEITNTDAEGRLVLSDALAYAAEQFKPKYMIDLATLTGACMVALGDRYAGLFGNDKELAEKLRAAGDEVDELLWEMPIHKDFAEKMKGQYADLRNSDTGSERDAGASKGAAFLQEFVGKTKWAHLDIAGPAWTGDPKKYESKGATGFGVRLLLRFLLSQE